MKVYRDQGSPNKTVRILAETGILGGGTCHIVSGTAHGFRLGRRLLSRFGPCRCQSTWGFEWVNVDSMTVILMGASMSIFNIFFFRVRRLSWVYCRIASRRRSLRSSRGVDLDVIEGHTIGPVSDGELFFYFLSRWTDGFAEKGWHHQVQAQYDVTSRTDWNPQQSNQRWAMIKNMMRMMSEYVRMEFVPVFGSCTQLRKRPSCETRPQAIPFIVLLVKNLRSVGAVG